MIRGKRTRRIRRRKKRRTRRRRRSKSVAKKSGPTSTIFVLYKLKDNAEWSYAKNLIGTWIWVGSGGTNHRQYPLEEQFSGPISSKNTFSKKLRDKFSVLKRQGKVKHFLIRDQYPHA